nr:hypothetical protein Cry52Nrm3_p069 [Cryptomonas curvata]
MEKKKKIFKFSFFCKFSFNANFNNNYLLLLNTYKWQFYQLVLFFKKKKCIYNNYHKPDNRIILYLKKKNTKYTKKNLLYIKLKNYLKSITDENLQKNLYLLTKLRIFFYFLCKKILLYQLKN